jgi:hypothetical protein
VNDNINGGGCDLGVRHGREDEEKQAKLKQ